MKSGDLLAIGEVSVRSGVATSALRYYETLELITSHRTQGNHRVYRRSVLRRLAVIQAAQHVGMSLEEIGTALSRFDSEHAPTKSEWATLARSWKPLLDRKIAELEQVRNGLAECVGCGCLSMKQCAIYNPEDSLASSGSGARRVFPHTPDA